MSAHERLNAGHARLRAHFAARLKKTEQIQASQARLDQSLGAVRSKIGRLEGQIAELERRNTETKLQIAQTQQQITTRTQEIQANANGNRSLALFGALSGRAALAFGGLANKVADDARLKQLGVEQQRLEAQRAQVDEQIRVYGNQKRDLTARLGRLQDSAKQFASASEALLASSATSLQAAGQRLQLSHALLRNLRGQVSLLNELRDKASDLGGVLDAHLADLQTQLVLAERLADESTKQYVNFLKEMLKGGANMSLKQWVSKEVTARVASELKRAGLDPNAAQQIARMLAKSVFSQPSDAAQFENAVSASLDAS
jgi:chromosome segregation ATPase